MDKHFIREICDMKECLTEKFHSQIQNGIDQVDTEEAYKVADIIKDLAETVRNTYEGEYYKTVIEAMEEGNEPERLGYSPRKMMYRPYLDQEPYIENYLNDPDFTEKMRMGYTGEGRDMREANRMMRHETSRYGNAYNNYRIAKKHYTATNSQEDKKEMDMYSNEHLADVVASIREMWGDADPAMRQRIKKDLTKLMEDMTA